MQVVMLNPKKSVETIMKESVVIGSRLITLSSLKKMAGPGLMFHRT